MTTRLGSFLLIRQQEYRHVAYFFGLFFLIGGGMAMGRGTADALFFKRYGIEYLPVMYIVGQQGLVETVQVGFRDDLLGSLNILSS